MITSKLIYSVLFAFILSSILGPILIPILRKLKFGQNIREDGPKSHLKKAGTPTIGGAIFIFSALIAMFLLVRKVNDEAMIALYAFIAFGAVGFLDDFLKIIHKKNEGLKSYQKMILLIIVSSVIAVYASKYVGTDIIIPFMHITVNLGFLYIPFIIIYFVGTTNAVNLTDGLDGLCTSITLLVVTFLCVVCFGMQHITLAIFCAVIVGALLGFLRFNAFPARVFMGDTGSLALGGAIGAVAMILKLEIIIIIVGAVYVAEALSVIIQVASFKLTGKRVFKMAPIHHHFEIIGWHETKIVSTFSIITIILCLIAFLSL